MKPVLNKCLRRLVLSACVIPFYAAADYNGGQILNQNHTYDGNINISYSNNHDDATYFFGAVERSGEEGSDGETILRGNINISAGNDYADNTDDTIRGSALITVKDSTNSKITLETVNADDRIIMQTYTKGATVVENSGVNATVTLDARNSDDQTIVLIAHNEASTNPGGGGISTNSGATTNVYGNLKVTTNQVSSIGLYTLGGSSVYISGSYEYHAGNDNATAGMVLTDASNSRIEGNVNIASKASTVRVYTGSTAVFNGSLNTIQSGATAITVQSAGIVELNGITTVSSTGTGRGIEVSGEGSKVISHGDLKVSATTVHDGRGAVYATQGGKVQLNGISYMNSGSLPSLQANNLGQITGMGKYTFSGHIRATDKGIVDMTMQQHSIFTGITSLDSNAASIVNLTLEDNSLWTVTGNSTLSNLTLGQGSALQFAFDGTSLTDIISAMGTITLEAGSMICLTGDLSGLQGNSFDFFSGTLVNNGVEFVAFDGSGWVKYEYTQTGANTFEFKADVPVVIEEPGFIPEPATATLGLLGLASLMLRRRK